MAQAAAVVAAEARVVDKEVAVVTKAAVRRAAAAEADRAAAIANEKPEASSEELAFFLANEIANRVDLSEQPPTIISKWHHDCHFKF